MGLGSFREAIVDRVEFGPHRTDVGGDLLRRLVLDGDAGEQVRDLVHLRFPHSEPRELLRPEADAARLHRRRVPRKEVLVRDDVRLLQVPGDFRATAEGRDIQGDRVALCETVLLREDLDPASVERLGEGLRVPDDLRGVVAAEFQEFRERDPEGRHRMEMVVRHDAGENGPLQPLDELLVLGVGEQDPVLRSRQHGILLSDSEDEKFIKRLQRAVFPGVVSNHHLHAMAALGITLAEFLEFGRDYAAQIVRNAKALAQALHGRGIQVLAEKHGFTQSHAIALDVAALGGGAKVAGDLEKANIITNKNLLPWDTSSVKPSGIRLGTQELTRLRMRESEMDEVADLFARVAVKHEPPEKVASDVGAMRTEFNTVQYCFTKGAEAHRRWRIA